MVSYKQSFALLQMLTDGLQWWIIEMFLSAVWTHSLQRIRWWESDVMLQISKNVQMKKQLIHMLDGLSVRI